MIASREYLSAKWADLFEREGSRGPYWKPIAIVARVQFVRERVYPWHDQVLHDYYVTFRDGTTDCLSFTPVQGPPKIGEGFCRALYVWGGDFVRWGEP